MAKLELPNRRNQVNQAFNSRHQKFASVIRKLCLLALHQNICAAVVDVSLSLIEFCALRITRIIPKISFPTVIYSLSSIFAWLCSGLTVAGSARLVRSSQSASLFKST